MTEVNFVTDLNIYILCFLLCCHICFQMTLPCIDVNDIPHHTITTNGGIETNKVKIQCVVQCISTTNFVIYEVKIWVLI